MTPSQRSVLLAFAAGAVGFVVVFALGVAWWFAAALGAILAVSCWSTLSYLMPTDEQSELATGLAQIDKSAGRIRALSHRVSDRETAEALAAGCDGVPRMIELIRQRDVAVALPLSQRSLAYLTDVASTLEDYIEVQDGADTDFLQLGQRELKRLAEFTSQPDRELSERRMDDYINSLTALNMNPPPELT